jgi:hypothetical protein
MPHRQNFCANRNPKPAAPVRGLTTLWSWHCVRKRGLMGALGAVS